MNRRQFLLASSAAMILPGIVKAESIMRINPLHIITPVDFNAAEGTIIFRHGWNQHGEYWIADKCMSIEWIEKNL